MHIQLKIEHVKIGTCLRSPLNIGMDMRKMRIFLKRDKYSQTEKIPNGCDEFH